ncbi:helix-turn-helix domain-containing protein [Patescibacteria group bacterium]|nr:helix-turn-helix domain-containing protein [Patescibacteria group bacterium]
MDREWLSVKEVAHICNVSVDYLISLRRHGNGPAYYRFGRKIQYRHDDVSSWLASLKH